MDPGPSSEPAELSFEEAEALLRGSGSIEVLGLLPNSSNYTYLARLDKPLGAEGDALAVYKPAQGESPLWDFPDGSLHRREVAAYRLARFLGWPLIPPTVTRREAPMGVGSLQLFVPSESGRAFFSIRDEQLDQLLPVALFDVIANNADRKAGHHLRDGSGRLWVIDHGLTFHAEPKLRTIIWDFAGEPLPPAFRPDLERALAAVRGGELAAELDGLISVRELGLLERRLRGVLQPGWLFPSPTSAWSVPWPPI
ncbi:MAG TPA: hypothetical protein VNG93_10590 [Candidatus Dormibacteraeota bacterium]|nr:hypothetical protein [Candidatus Dormibacteraeota bacterium]